MDFFIHFISPDILVQDFLYIFQFVDLEPGGRAGPWSRSNDLLSPSVILYSTCAATGLTEGDRRRQIFISINTN